MYLLPHEQVSLVRWSILLIIYLSQDNENLWTIFKPVARMLIVSRVYIKLAVVNFKVRSR